MKQLIKEWLREWLGITELEEDLTTLEGEVKLIENTADDAALTADRATDAINALETRVDDLED